MATCGGGCHTGSENISIIAKSSIGWCLEWGRAVGTRHKLDSATFPLLLSISRYPSFVFNHPQTRSSPLPGQWMQWGLGGSLLTWGRSHPLESLFVVKCEMSFPSWTEILLGSSYSVFVFSYPGTCCSKSLRGDQQPRGPQPLLPSS